MSTTTTITRSITMIAVSTPGNPHDHEYHDASRWHVDDSGHLHIVAGNNGGNVATYQSGMWLHVEKRDKGAMPGPNKTASEGIAAVGDLTVSAGGPDNSDAGEVVEATLWNGVVLRASAKTDPVGHRALSQVQHDNPENELFREFSWRPAQHIEYHVSDLDAAIRKEKRRRVGGEGGGGAAR